MSKDLYKFDIHKKEMVSDCHLYPTETNYCDFNWLRAANNKYTREDRDVKKAGSWVIQLPKDCVNATWDKIKMAVTNGKLWQAGVSTTDPKNPDNLYTVMIDTKDYTDVDDVIQILDYLESSEIKPSNMNIKYEKHKVSDSGHNEIPLIYSSNLIRAMGSSIYEYDLHKKEVMLDCKFHPTEALKKDVKRLYARNNKFTRDSLNPKKIGKWRLVFPEDEVNTIWDEIKMAVRSGKLWDAEVSTSHRKFEKIDYEVLIYTKNYNDLNDVVSVLDYLETSGIKSSNMIIAYAPSQPRCDNGAQMVVFSETIRKIAATCYIYDYDIQKKELVSQCSLQPTEVCISIPLRLIAKNNKYSDESLDPDKVGKWTFFLSKDSVNAVWEKIKVAVTDGELWRAKVSITDPTEPKAAHTVMVYTKDLTELADVIHVLSYLEILGIKPPDENLKYEKNKQKAVATEGGKARSWIYSSNLIRSMGDSIHHHYNFDIRKKELVTDSKLCPTETLKSDFVWLYASNNVYFDISIEPKKTGCWVLLLPKDSVNATWDKIKMAVAEGDLWRSRVSTTDLRRPNDTYTVMIGTKDYTDLDDVIRVLDYLEHSGMKQRNANVKYLLDLQLDGDVLKGSEEVPGVYTSNTVRTVGSICQTYEFDIHKKKLITNCDLNPTEFCKIPPFIIAKNNKYLDESIDSEKVGKWTFFSRKESVSAVWDKVKKATTNGELWRSEVSTVDPEKPKDLHSFAIFTKDYTDLDDVIHVLECLESLGIKPPNRNIKYEKDKKSSIDTDSKDSKRPWIYSSNLIRSVGGSIHDTYEYDIRRKELITDCKLYPTKTLESDYGWLNAVNNKYPGETSDSDEVGFWHLLPPKDRVDATWDQIKRSVADGELWDCCVSTTDPEMHGEPYSIQIFTKDHADLEDVIQVLDYLESSGIKSPNENIMYFKRVRRSTSANGAHEQWLYSSNLIRSVGGSISDTYKFDIHKRKIVTDCKIYPTEALKSDFEWISAQNNKYTVLVMKKIGKWMIFLTKDRVNDIWDKIKMGVASGDLWRSKVSTTDPERPEHTHAIMIYTIDYTDVDDVINVLDYLESSGIKPPNVTLKYKIDEQTRAGIYSGGRERTWIYSSDSIRSSHGIIQDTYEFDILKQELVTDCTLVPTKTLGGPPWIYARNNKYPNMIMDPEKVGKWLLFLREDTADAVWDKIKMAVTSGELWSNKVSTFRKKNYPVGDSYTVMIYTKDCDDREDVTRVLDYLESSGIKSRTEIINYRTDDILKTPTGYQSDRSWKPKPPMYSSNTIKSKGSIQFMNNFIQDTYEFDIRKKELISDCSLVPTQALGKPAWLHAKNNKYPKEIIDPKKVGKWVLFLQEDVVDGAWDRIKTAVARGELWSVKVSTFRRKNYPVGDSYTIMIFTKDCTDLQDIIQVLDYLERSRLKPRSLNIAYKTEEETRMGYQAGGQRQMYSSNTIRSDFKMDLPWR